MVGEISECPIIKFDHFSDIDHWGGDRLVLAELFIGDMQIGDFDPPECHIPAGGSLRVIHGGRNQIVDIDGLDVKCALHALATGTQEINHMLLIRTRIKGRPRLRLGRELTECQSNGENLDEDSVHFDSQLI